MVDDRGELIEAIRWALGAERVRFMAPGEPVPWDQELGADHAVEFSAGEWRLAIDPQVDEDDVVLTLIAADPPGTGLGSRAMEAVGAFAERKGLGVYVAKVANPRFCERFLWLDDWGPGGSRVVWGADKADLPGRLRSCVPASKPVRELRPLNGETSRCYLGVAKPLVSPEGVQCECGDDAPVDVWLVMRGRRAELVRNSSRVPAPPPRQHYCGGSAMPLAELAADFAKGEWNWYRREYARIAVRALNAGAMPEDALASVARLHGYEALRGVFENAGEPLLDKGAQRLAAQASTPLGPTTVLRAIGGDGAVVATAKLRL